MSFFIVANSSRNWWNILRARIVPAREYPDIIVALSMIAMDPASSPQTKMDIGFSIHRICASLSEDLKLCSEIVRLCNFVCSFTLLMSTDTGRGDLQ